MAIHVRVPILDLHEGDMDESDNGKLWKELAFVANVIAVERVDGPQIRTAVEGWMEKLHARDRGCGTPLPMRDRRLPLSLTFLVQSYTVQLMILDVAS
jgi:hypothetical protein